MGSDQAVETGYQATARWWMAFNEDRTPKRINATRRPSLNHL